jgi:hypothetical protein
VTFRFGFRRHVSISKERDSAADEFKEDIPLPCIQDVTKIILWDIAVGCLALSVKVGHLPLKMVVFNKIKI